MKNNVFKKLKVAVGIYGNFVFLEKFPVDEYHENMNENLPDLESNSDFNDAPGIYLATLEYTTTQSDHTGDTDVYLEVVKIEKIPGGDV